MSETTPGREPVQIVELWQPACALTYGVTPCTAAVGITGAHKCFNTTKTCQDRAALTLTDFIVWRFVKPTARPLRGLYEEISGVIKTIPIPALVSVSTSPSRINVGGGDETMSPFGRRASITITLQDHPYDDSAADKYLGDRSYDPLTQSTFWAKWLARNPYFNGYQIIIYEGYAEQTLDEMRSRLYLLESVDEPNSAGGVRLVAKDPLRLADDKRAIAPAASEAELRDAIDETQTAGIVVVADESVINATLGNTGTTRYIRFGDEIMEYTGYSGPSGGTEWTLSGVTRSALDTLAAAHEAGRAAQRVLRYVNYPSWLIAYDLLLNHTDGAADFVSLYDWSAEGSVWLAGSYFTGTVAKPTPVNELMGELAESAACYFHWNERTQQVRLNAIRVPDLPPQEVNDTAHIVADSFSSRSAPQERVTQVWVYFNQRNPTKDLDDSANYAQVRIRKDLAAESPEEGGQRRIRRVFSRWARSHPQAIQIAARLLNRYRDIPRYITLRLDAKNRDIWTADIIDVTHRSFVDPTGVPAAQRWQVISAEEVRPGEIVEYSLQTFEFIGRYARWMDNYAPLYQYATDAERSGAGFWWSGVDGKLPNGDEGYKWQ